MATPKPPSYGYGVALPQSSPTVTQPQAPSNIGGLLGGLFGGPQQGNLDALLKILKANQQNPGFMGGMPPQAPQQIPPYSPNIDDMGEPDVNFRPGNPQDHIMPPGFVAQPVPMLEARPEEVSTFPIPPRAPVGRPVGGVPPYMPGSVSDMTDVPYGTTPDLSPGKQPQPQQGTNMRSLFDVLRAMQGRANAPQAPFVPDYMLPINQNAAPIDPNMPISDEQRKRMLQALSGGAPRMPSPTPVPRSEMGGRSNMGLGGILNAIRASRQR